jgi:D-beta-D-heptose 7-phosphate kinase/D-beta-D-heptose 1-phosphate adenosyltransferase
MNAPRHPHDKILTREDLVARFGRARQGKVVFTNGCFDLLHRGHVEYLYSARALGDALVLGLNSDASVRRLKGPERPVVSEQDRAVVIAALGCIDAVTIFDEDTPRDLIAALLPDVLVKGGDYRPEDVVGRAEVEGAGGRVVIIPFLEGRSTTGLIHRMRENER